MVSSSDAVNATYFELIRIFVSHFGKWNLEDMSNYLFVIC